MKSRFARLNGRLQSASEAGCRRGSECKHLHNGPELQPILKKVIIVYSLLWNIAIIADSNLNATTSNSLPLSAGEMSKLVSLEKEEMNFEPKPGTAFNTIVTEDQYLTEFLTMVKKK